MFPQSKFSKYQKIKFGTASAVAKFVRPNTQAKPDLHEDLRYMSCVVIKKQESQFQHQSDQKLLGVFRKCELGSCGKVIHREQGGTCRIFCALNEDDRVHTYHIGCVARAIPLGSVDMITCFAEKCRDQGRLIHQSIKYVEEPLQTSPREMPTNESRVCVPNSFDSYKLGKR